jgi:hypothetical protein
MGPFVAFRAITAVKKADSKAAAAYNRGGGFFVLRADSFFQKEGRPCGRPSGYTTPGGDLRRGSNCTVASIPSIVGNESLDLIISLKPDRIECAGIFMITPWKKKNPEVGKVPGVFDQFSGRRDQPEVEVTLEVKSYVAVNRVRLILLMAVNQTGA